MLCFYTCAFLIAHYRNQIPIYRSDMSMNILTANAAEYQPTQAMIWRRSGPPDAQNNILLNRPGDSCNRIVQFFSVFLSLSLCASHIINDIEMPMGWLRVLRFLTLQRSVLSSKKNNKINVNRIKDNPTDFWGLKNLSSLFVYQLKNAESFGINLSAWKRTFDNVRPNENGWSI